MATIRPTNVSVDSTGARPLVKVDYNSGDISSLAPAKARALGRKLQEIADAADQAEDRSAL